MKILLRIKKLICKDEIEFRGATNTREESNKTKKSNKTWSKRCGNSLFLLKLLIGNFLSCVGLCSGSSSSRHAGRKAWLPSTQGHNEIKRDASALQLFPAFCPVSRTDGTGIHLFQHGTNQLDFSSALKAPVVIQGKVTAGAGTSSRKAATS